MNAIENIGHIDLIIHVRTIGSYVHKCASYEVPMIKPFGRNSFDLQITLH